MGNELKDGEYLENINEEELSRWQKRKLKKFKTMIEKGLPELRKAYVMVVDSLKQIKELKEKTEEEKIKLEEKIRKDIVLSLVKSMAILVIEDKEGNEETETTLNEKTTDELVTLLNENIIELEKFVNGKE